MIIPIGDDNSGHRVTPWINYLFIALNLFVFIFLQQGGQNLAFTYAFGAVPAEILTGMDIVTQNKEIIDEYTGNSFFLYGLQPTPVPVYFTLVTCMFMHGGLGHLIGNLIYLWVFGDNLENRMGHAGYLWFYLLTGIIASLTHVFSVFLQPGIELIPMIGASGAISAVIGGNILLLPHRKVTVLLFFWPLRVSAFFALGMWIVFQVIDGLGALGGTADRVAYSAHIGGFIAGLALVKFFDKQGGRKHREAWAQRGWRR